MSLLKENIIMAMRSVAHNKVRSALTLLGVLIGVSSVVALVALGQGAQVQVSENLQTLGANLIQISSGQSRGSSFIRRGPGSSPTLTGEDYQFVQSLVGRGISRASPELSSNQQLRSPTDNTQGQVYGVNFQYPDIRNLKVSSGEWFTPQDETSRSRVVILGYQSARDLFPDQDPLGEKIRIRNQSFTVTGVLESKGNSMGDRSAYIPLETYRRYFSTSTKYSSISIQAVDQESMDSLQ